MKRRNVLAGFVVALGCSQMIGYLTGAKTVSACGAGTCFAPMAEVFSSIETGTPGERFEPFAAEFSVRGTDGSDAASVMGAVGGVDGAGGEGVAGAVFERCVTPETMALIEGPHARRANYANAFVAVARGEADLAAAEATWCFGLGSDGPLRAALELPAGAQALVIQVAARGDERAGGDELARERGKTWTLALDCTR